MPAVARIKALTWAGSFAIVQDDYAAARSALAESLALSRELGYDQGIATAQMYFGTVAWKQGDYAAALSLQDKLALLHVNLFVETSPAPVDGLTSAHRRILQTRPP